LAKKRIQVSSQLVSAIRGRTVRRRSSDQVNVNQLVAAKSLVDHVGGIRQARQAIEAIEKLGAT